MKVTDLKHRHMRRRLIERWLKKLGLSRTRAKALAARIF